MGFVKIAVCDDEIIFARKLEKIINKYCTVKQIPFQIDIYQSERNLLLII